MSEVRRIQMTARLDFRLEPGEITHARRGVMPVTVAAPYSRPGRMSTSLSLRASAKAKASSSEKRTVCSSAGRSRPNLTPRAWLVREPLHGASSTALPRARRRFPFRLPHSHSVFETDSTIRGRERKSRRRASQPKRPGKRRVATSVRHVPAAKVLSFPSSGLRALETHCIRRVVCPLSGEIEDPVEAFPAGESRRQRESLVTSSCYQHQATSAREHGEATSGRVKVVTAPSTSRFP